MLVRRYRHRQEQVPDRVGSRDVQQRALVRARHLRRLRRDMHRQVQQKGKQTNFTSTTAG